MTVSDLPPILQKKSLQGVTVGGGMIFAESEKIRFSDFELWKGREKVGKERRIAETCRRFKSIDYFTID